MPSILRLDSWLWWGWLNLHVRHWPSGDLVQPKQSGAKCSSSVEMVVYKELCSKSTAEDVLLATVEDAHPVKDNDGALLHSHHWVIELQKLFTISIFSFFKIVKYFFSVLFSKIRMSILCGMFCIIPSNWLFWRWFWTLTLHNQCNWTHTLHADMHSSLMMEKHYRLKWSTATERLTTFPREPIQIFQARCENLPY